MADAPSPPSANNPYIRTYAKDVAALSGKPMPANPATASSAPAARAPVQTDTDREAVLARLRERAAADPVHESQLLPPTLPVPLPKAESIGSPEAFSAPPPPVSPPPAPVVVSAPPLQPLAPPVPPPPPRPAFVPPPAPPVAPQEASASPLHTYKSDFADRIDTQGASAFSVLAAQSDSTASAPKTVPPKKSRTGLLLAGGGVALVLLASVGGYFAYQYVQTHASVPIMPTVPSLVFADDRQAVKGEGSELVQALADSANTPLPDGQVRVLYLTEASTTPDGKTVNIPLSGGQLIGALQLSAPDILLRNVAPESTVGIVHAGSETRPFFIMKVLSYERTFAGMLEWEGTMQAALAALYPEYEAPAPPPPTIATTTKMVNGKKVVATTTVQAAPTVLAAPRFTDEVTANHDVRALKDGANRTLLLYGYKDKDTLIIARDEAAFTELVNRLSATKQQ